MELKTKKELALAAGTIAESYHLVKHGASLFMPMHWETGEVDPPPAADQTIWAPLSRDEVLQLANQKQKILFSSDAELRSFEMMTRQFSTLSMQNTQALLVKTDSGLKMLDHFGQLVDADGTFTPNYVRPKLNTDSAAKEFLFKTISGWVNSDEQAESLLSHLATVLSPHYSAVKYILLIGDGRNGKSLLLLMLQNLFGSENVSHVSRQRMSEGSSICVELNNKLVNIVFDGEMTYIKDSAMEKTLVAGEAGHVRMLYDSNYTQVQTNALFIEGLNREPRNRDKSTALQKRLVRFFFPNVYPMDHAFSKKMLSEDMLGALLSLLVDRYVMHDEIAERLKPTAKSMELQMEQMFLDSPMLQFFKHWEVNHPREYKDLVNGKMQVEPFIVALRMWMIEQNMSERNDGDLLAMLKTVAIVTWKTVRIEGTPTSRRVIKELKPETVSALAALAAVNTEDEEEHDGAEPELDELVGD